MTEVVGLQLPQDEIRTQEGMGTDWGGLLNLKEWKSGLREGLMAFNNDPSSAVAAWAGKFLQDEGVMSQLKREQPEPGDIRTISLAVGRIDGAVIKINDNDRDEVQENQIIGQLPAYQHRAETLALAADGWRGLRERGSGALALEQAKVMGAWRYGDGMLDKLAEASGGGVLEGEALAEYRVWLGMVGNEDDSVSMEGLSERAKAVIVQARGQAEMIDGYSMGLNAKELGLVDEVGGVDLSKLWDKFVADPAVKREFSGGTSFAKLLEMVKMGASCQTADLFEQMAKIAEEKGVSGWEQLRAMAKGASIRAKGETAIPARVVEPETIVPALAFCT